MHYISGNYDEADAMKDVAMSVHASHDYDVNDLQEDSFRKSIDNAIDKHIEPARREQVRLDVLGSTVSESQATGTAGSTERRQVSRPPLLHPAIAHNHHVPNLPTHSHAWSNLSNANFLYMGSNSPQAGMRPSRETGAVAASGGAGTKGPMMKPLLCLAIQSMRIRI